jgi:DNA-binding beta-propeller fold protein YncE
LLSLLTGLLIADAAEAVELRSYTCTPGEELSRLEGEDPRTDYFLYHRGYLIQARHGSGVMTVWDIDDPTAPTIERVYDPGWGGMHVHSYLGEIGLLQWAAHHQIDLSRLPEMVSLDYAVLDPRDDALQAMGDNPDGMAQVYYPWGFGNTPWAYGYRRKGFFTVHDLREPRVQGLHGLSREPLATVEVMEETGLEGRVNLIGNLLIVTGDNEMPQGVAVYDLSDPARPVLLDSIRTTADGEPLIKAYDSVPVWGSYVALIQNGDTTTRGVDLVDISDPTDLRHVGRFDFPGRTRYAQFQDEFMFVGDAKVDMTTFEVVETFPDSGGEYSLPLGNLLVTAGMDRTATGRIFCHQAAPDTRPPMVTFHNPADGETDVEVTARVGLVIPETLDLATLNTDSVVLRPIGGEAVDGDVVFTDHDVLNFTPRELLQDDTTYELVLPAGGLSDVAGNALAEDFRFTFSTGDSLDLTPGQRLLNGFRRAVTGQRGGERDLYRSPEITEAALSRASAAVGQAVTFEVEAQGERLGTLEYNFIWGDGQETGYQPQPAASYAYPRPGRFTAQVRVRGRQGHFTARARTISVYDQQQAPGVSSSSLAMDADARRVWNVNPDNDTVTAIDADTGDKLLEVAVPADPRSVAVAPDGSVWVSSHDAAAVSVLSGEDGALLAEIPLPPGSRPHGLVIDRQGARAYVAAMGTGRIHRLDVEGRALIDALEVGPWPRALALSHDGATLLATRFISPQGRGEVYRIDTEAFTSAVIPLAMDATTVDSDRATRGVPNYLASVAITPDGRSAWVGSLEANVLRGAARDGLALTFESTLRSVISVIDLEAGAEIAGARVDIDNQELPSAITFSDDGAFAFLSYQGNNEVLVLSTGGVDGYRNRFSGFQLIERIPAGRAPTGVVIDPVTGHVFIHSFLSRSVKQVALDTQGAGKFQQAASGDRWYSGFIAGMGLVSQTTTVAQEALPPLVLRGKKLFYDASDARISKDGYISCASCHLDGEHDGRVWDFTDRGEGLRNTISLQGRRGDGHGPVHWSANFDEIQDFEHDMRGPFAGGGLMSWEQFQGAHPLGAPKAGQSADLDALAAYLRSLDTFGVSPHRDADGGLTATGEAGRVVFERAGCGDCHGGADYTDSASGVRHDVGTLKSTSGGRLGGQLVGLDTPTLRGLWSTAPYLHDGSAASLEDALRVPGHGASLSDADRVDLVSFLLQLDDGAPGAAGPAAAPAIHGLEPGQPLSQAMVTLEVRGEGIDRVQYFVNDAPIGGSAAAPFALAWRPAGDGDYRVFARVSSGDRASLTPELAVTVDRCPQVFCEDFEDDPVGAGPGAPWANTGGVVVSAERAHSGERALKVTAAGGGYTRSFSSLALGGLGAVERSLYGRMMVQVQGLGAPGGDYTFASVEGGPKPASGAPAGTLVFYRFRVAEQSGHATNGSLMANYDTWVDADGDNQTEWHTDCWNYSEVILPTDRWACVEWSFDVAADRLRFWLGGEEIEALRVEGAHDNCADTSTQGGWWTAPERLQALNLGIEQYHAEALPRTLYIDDVVVSDAPIGCP